MSQGYAQPKDIPNEGHHTFVVVKVGRSEDGQAKYHAVIDTGQFAGKRVSTTSDEPLNQGERFQGFLHVRASRWKRGTQYSYLITEIEPTEIPPQWRPRTNERFIRR